MIWFGKKRLLGLQKYHQRNCRTSTGKRKLSQRNQIIAAEIKDLKEGVDAIEERARSQHEMVKPNETFYHIVKEHK